MPTPPSDGMASSPWNPPAPSGVPELRAAMARQMGSPYEIAHNAEALARGLGSITPNAPTPEAAARLLCEQEHQRLREAQLYFVTAEMTRLAVTAGESLPDFHLEPEDLPAPTGFIVFEEAVGSYINTDGTRPIRVPIVAVSWRQFDAPHFPQGGVWFTYYSPTDGTRSSA